MKTRTAFALIIFIFLFIFILGYRLNYNVGYSDRQFNTTSFSLPHCTGYFIDKEGKKSFNELQKVSGDKFEKKEIPVFGHTLSTVWGKVTCPHQLNHLNNWYLVFFSERLEDLNLYIVYNDHIVQHHHDASMAFYERLIPGRQIIFPVLQPQNIKEIYFSGTSSQFLDLSYSFATPAGLAYENGNNLLFYGIYYGFMAAILFYNIFIFLTIREKAYFYYIIFTISHIFMQAGVDGFLFQYIFPENYFFARNMRSYLIMTAMLFSVLFWIEFSQMKTRSRIFYHLYQFLAWITLIPFFLQVFAGFIPAINFINIYSAVILLTFFITALSQSRLAINWYYIIGWLFFALGIVVHQLVVFNIFIFPFSKNLDLPMKIGNMLEALFLSFALANRIKNLEINIAKRDHELNELRYTNLKDKMQPHFVLNTLAIISAFIHTDTASAEKTISHLSRTYQYLLLNTERSIVSLSNEISFAREYANLLLIKHSNSLKIRFHVKGILKKNIWIPTLTVQPLIENSYKHGIRKLRKGTIKIFVHIKGEIVTIQISNSSDGKPLSELYNGTLGTIKKRMDYYFPGSSFHVENQKNLTIVMLKYKNGNLVNNSEIDHLRF